MKIIHWTDIDNLNPTFHIKAGEVEFKASYDSPYKARYENKSAIIGKEGLYIVNVFIDDGSEEKPILAESKTFGETEIIQAVEYAYNYLTTLQKEEVWGVFDLQTMTHTYKGMIVARGVGKVDAYFTQEQRDSAIAQIPEVCPIWGDTLPRKSVTVICNADQEDDVSYWLHHVHGAYCVSARLELKDGRIAMRSDYMCE